MKTEKKRSNRRPVKPEVFSYHDCRLFLADQLSFIKNTIHGYTLSKLANQSGLSKGYLSMVLKGKWKLTSHALQRVIPFLDLTSIEQTYLNFLLSLENAETLAEKTNALEAMHKLKGYQRKHPREALVSRYFSQWHNVAIRELAYLPDFKLDASWIQKRLREFIPLVEVEKSIRFLIDNHFLEVGVDGKVKQSYQTLECVDEIFKTVMLSYHEQLYRLAVKQVPKLEPKDKNLTAYMVALSPENFAAAKKLLAETLEKIVKIGESEKEPDSLYHFTLLGFSLTHEKEEPKEEKDK